MSPCAGRIRVRTSDWGLVAKLDRQAPWAKVCLMMMQYLGSLNPADVGGTSWSGRRDHFAAKLSKDVIDELQTEVAFLVDVQEKVMLYEEKLRALDEKITSSSKMSGARRNQKSVRRATCCLLRRASGR